MDIMTDNLIKAVLVAFQLTGKDTAVECTNDSHKPGYNIISVYKPNAGNLFALQAILKR